MQSPLFSEPQPRPSFPSRGGAPGSAFIGLDQLAPAPSRRAPGIARLAAEASEMDQRNEVEYRDLACRTAISPCDSRRVPFTFTINPYRGCEFGCVYCYARYTHEFMELQAVRDFERKIFVKRGVREALLGDLRRRDFRGEWIALGTATDPYQPAERRFQLTRGILEVLAARRGLRLTLTTKSDLVVRDLDLLQRLREHNQVEVNVTITTPHHGIARKTEPRAPRPDKRLAAVARLVEGGVRAGVFLMPLLPRINDRTEDLDLLIRLAKEHGAGYLAAAPLFLRDCSRPTFNAFIRDQFPHLEEYYRRLFSTDRSESLAAYGREKLAEVAALKRKHGLAGHQGMLGKPAAAPDQPALDL